MSEENEEYETNSGTELPEDTGKTLDDFLAESDRKARGGK